ncbi:fungal-specific transcription factor domain-containing protein [Annulohypoxylon nitens]|nr:fungal-specific transcription factor domain-containing protein [Annulohypoxylon nitens]
MEGTHQIERRKACDVCYYKKIKCNMAKPSCSNCELYQTPCKTSLIRRRAQPQPKPSAKSQSGITSSIGDKPDNDVPSPKTRKNETLEERVAYLESQLSQLAQASSVSRDTSASASKHDLSVNQPLGISPPLILPPLDDILPSVERYFEHTNSFIPLFDKSDFNRILMDWYHPSSNSGHDHLKTHSRQTVFAAINVVVALSFRVPSSLSQDLSLGEEHPMVELCMRNTERVVMDLINSAEDLVILQVLLGMMVLYLGSRNSQLVTTLVGSAVQLCHRLRLYSSEENADFQPLVKIKRERLFWITYILDKEVSMRYHTPPLLSDDDVDVELSAEQEGNQDIFSDFTQDSAPFAFFHHRIQLAGIQALVYQQLYSSSSNPSKVPPEQRRARVLLLDAHLENWRRRIPVQLQLNSLVETLFPDGLATDVSEKRMGIFTHMVELHFAYMGLLVRIHGVWSHDADWLKLISSFSQQVVRDCGERGSKCGIQLGPFPKQWDRCVKASRECLMLAQKMPLAINNIWSTGCAYVSSLIILLANQLQSHDIAQMEIDHDLTKHGLVMFVKIKEASSWPPLHQLHSVIMGLDARATREVVTTRLPSTDLRELQALTADLPALEHAVPGEWNFAAN